MENWTKRTLVCTLYFVFLKNGFNLKQGDLLENVLEEKNTDVNIFSIENGMAVEEMVEIVNQFMICAMFCADFEFEKVIG